MARLLLLSIFLASTVTAAKDYSFRGQAHAFAKAFKSDGSLPTSSLMDLSIQTARLAKDIRRPQLAALTPQKGNFEHVVRSMGKGNVTSPCRRAINSVAEELGKVEKNLAAIVNCSLAGNTTCVKDLGLDLLGYEWMARLLDATGKVPAGLDLGAGWWPGSWSECWQTSPPSHLSFSSFRYCSLNLSPARIIKDEEDERFSKEMVGQGHKISLDIALSYIASHGIDFGICIPAACLQSDVASLVNQDFQGEPIEVQCNEQDISHRLGSDPRAIAIICILCLFGLVMAAGTVLDVVANFESLSNSLRSYQIYKLVSPEFVARPMWVELVMGFSVYRNTKKLISVEKKEGELRVIHGIRFLSMVWVILGHSYAFAATKFDNVIIYLQDLGSVGGQVINNATLSVDSFFAMSGFLVAFLFLKGMEKSHGRLAKSPKFWLSYVLHRYVRLSPAYLLVLGTLVSLSPYMASGPLWPQDRGFEQDFCRHTWWTNALYINNFVGPHLIPLKDSAGEASIECFGHSWYLANDMQFYLVAPVFLLLLWRCGMWGVVVAAFVAFVSAFLRGLVTFQHDLNPTFMAGSNAIVVARLEASSETAASWGWELYTLPWFRISSYIAGLLSGYLFWRLKGRVNWAWHWICLAWALSLGSMTFVLFSVGHYAETGEMSLGARALYSALNRGVWAVGIGWIIVACGGGKGGPINAILSWDVWVPFSRLTYCAYLVHPYVIYLYLNSASAPFHYSGHISCLYMFAANLIVAYCFAYLFSIAFEAPIMSVERLLRSTQQQSDSSAPDSVNNPNYKEEDAESGPSQ